MGKIIVGAACLVVIYIIFAMLCGFDGHKCFGKKDR